MYFEVDPRDPLNAVIVNLDKAPRNAQGLVEFSAPFVIIKPVDMARGNRKILYGINNRGNNIELRFHDSRPAAGHNAVPDAHDGLLFSLGYTYVDAGWAGDIVTTDDAPRRHAAGRRPAGRPADRRADPHRVLRHRASRMPLKGNTQFRSYETADTDTRAFDADGARSVDGAQKRQCRTDRWAFGRCPNGQSLARRRRRRHLCCSTAFSPNIIYELTYPAQEPVGDGPRLRGHARPRVVPALCGARTRRATPNPLARGRHDGRHPPRLRVRALRRPACTCATSCIWGSTRTRRTARSSMRSAS